MKLSVNVDGLTRLPRLNAAALIAHLNAEFELELQAISTIGRPLNASDHRDALNRAVANLLSARRVRR